MFATKQKQKQKPALRLSRAPSCAYGWISRNPRCVPHADARDLLGFPAGASCALRKGEEDAGGHSPQCTPMQVSGRSLRRRRHLLLVVVLAVELLVPVEAGGLQGLFAGGALHALLMPEAVVEPQQKPV